MSRSTAAYADLHGRADAGRRVIQCACGRSLAWNGITTLVAATLEGWTKSDGRRWRCPDCFSPPPVAAASEPVERAVPDYLWSLCRSGSRADRDAAEQQLELMHQRAPERFAAALRQLALPDEAPRALRPLWRAFLKRHEMDAGGRQ